MSESQISVSHSTASHFQVTGHFDTSAPNDPKMTLNTKRSKEPLIHVPSTPEPKISIHFALQSAVFQVQAILRNAQQMTSKWPWTLQGQRYPIYLIQVSPSPKFHSIALYGSQVTGVMSCSRNIILNFPSHRLPYVAKNLWIWNLKILISKFCEDYHKEHNLQKNLDGK